MTQSQRDIMVTARGGGAVFAGRLFIWATRFVLAVLVARTLGAEEYGLYNLAIAIATVAGSVAVLGLDAAAVRFVSVFVSRRDWSGLMGTIQVTLGVPGIVSVATGLGIVLLADPIAVQLVGDPRMIGPLQLAGVLVPLLSINLQLGSVLQGLKHISYSVRAQSFGQPLLRIVLVAAFLLVGMTPGLAVLALVVASAASAALMIIYLRRLLPEPPPDTVARRDVGGFLRFSIPVLVSDLLITLGDNLQTLMLSALSTLAAVGIFSVSNQLTLVGVAFHYAVISSSMPVYAQLYDKGDHEGLLRLYQTASKWTLALNLPLSLVMIAFPSVLLSLFGRQFADGAQALQILALANLANAATGTAGAVLAMSGYTIFKAINAAVGLALAVGLNFWLIPTLGIVGAALTLLVSTATMNLLRLVEVAWLIRIQPYHRATIKPIIAGIGATAFAVAAATLLGPQRGGELVGIGTLLALYALLMLVQGLEPDDRLVLDRLSGRLRRLLRLSST